jgi:hypothetical protein
MFVRAGRSGAAAGIKVERKIYVHNVPHVPLTRVCVVKISSGVPVGTQVAWLSCNNTGCPSDVIRVAAEVNVAVAHGPLPALGGGIEQPATVQGAGKVTIGWPPTVTRELVTVGVAFPGACEQLTVAP